MASPIDEAIQHQEQRNMALQNKEDLHKAKTTDTQATTEQYRAGTDKQAIEDAQYKRSKAGMPSYVAKLEPYNYIKPDEPENTDSEEQTGNKKSSTSISGSFSPGMFADLGKYAGLIFGKSGRDITAGERDNKEQEHLGMSQAHQKAAEDAGAIAHRDSRVEADKDAVSQAASESAQNVNNLGASAGAAQAAAQRVKKVGDIQAYNARADAARKEMVENTEKRYDDLQAANETRALGKAADFKMRQREMNNVMSGALSMGMENAKGGGEAGISTEASKTKTKAPETSEEEEEEAQPETYVKTTTWEDGKQPEPSKANGQRVMNFMLGNTAGADPDDNEQALWGVISQKYGVKPVPQGQAQSYYPPNIYGNVDAWEGYYTSKDDDYGTAANKRAAADELRRIRSGGDVAKNLDRGHGNEQSQYAELPYGSNQNIVQGVTADRIQ